ncbi:hypothetical protein EJP67_02295 [Variovorax guangxiensis]|uniref:Uncharacterized protein n=1 Tax=Variovorax guangxiensis TaxID=1775474 RepID=A0A3S0Z0E1_9BURK|nr:hypothetical protein [Variovorax guangxiensis]RUR65884.1 hypothetical protein EJP67_02295 [Variovorax guangxiensis]
MNATRSPAEQRTPRTGAALILGTMPRSHAKAKAMEHGGAIHGPGTPTSDSVPIWASKDEFMLPADTTAAVGKHNLQALVDATHTPTNKAAQKMGRLARADGGLIDQQPGAVTRVGNSYSGGNVTGGVTINGLAPGGTVSTVDAFRAPPPPAQAPVLGTPAAVTPIAPKPVAPPMSALPAAGAATPPAVPAVAPPPPPPAAAPAPLDYANRNAAFNAGAMSRTADLQSGRARISGSASAAPPAGSAAATLAARPVQSIVGYADGGEIEDPRKQVLMNDPGVQLAALTPRQTMATTSDAAGGAMPAPPEPEMKPLPAGPRPYVAEIPYRRDERLAQVAAPAPAPVAASAEQAQVRRVDNAMAVETPAPASAPAPTAAVPESYQPAGSVGGVSGGVSAAERLAQLSRDVAFEKDKQTWRDPNAPTPGLAVIDNAASEADRRAQFNEQANLGNALARTTWSPRRGTQVNDAAVAAAMAPIDARARMAQLTVKEAGDTQRAQLAERGNDARARMVDLRQQQELGINQQRLALESKRVMLDANRDDRAAAAAVPKLAAEAREARLQELLLTGTPEERKVAAASLAAVKGRGLKGEEETGKALPSSAAQGFITNQSNLRTAQNALALLNGQTAGGLAGDTAATGAKGYAPNGLLNRLDPKGVDTRAAIANIGSMLVHDRAGAAVTASETPRLMPFIPAVTDDAATARKKLGQFITNYQAMNDDMATVYKESGYKIPTSPLRQGGADVPQGAAAAPPGAQPIQPPAQIASDADFHRLPSGTVFLDPNGNKRRKQ